MIALIVAADSNNGIGKNNTIPWNVTEDLKHFQTITKGNGNNAVIMGRKTWDSLPVKPLKNRLNIVLTSDKNFNECKSFDNFHSALEYAKQSTDIFIIGGSRVYKEALKNQLLLDQIFLTRIHKDFECDVFIDKIPIYFTMTTIEHGTCPDFNYEFVEYANVFPFTPLI